LRIKDLGCCVNPALNGEHFGVVELEVPAYSIHRAVLLKRGYQKNYQTGVRQNRGHITHLTRRTSFLHQTPKNQQPRQEHRGHQWKIDARKSISQREVSNGRVLSQNLSVEKVFLTSLRVVDRNCFLGY